MYPYQNPTIIAKALSTIKNIKWATLLDGTQKTLGVINQAIPVVYQIKPIVNNAKTLFKIANVMKDPQVETKEKETKKETNTSPIFYI